MMAGGEAASGYSGSGRPRAAFDERLLSEAVVATSLGVDDADLALDRLEPEGPWRTRRHAHYTALEIGKREGMDLFDSLQFIFGVKKAVSNVRLIDAVRQANTEKL